MAEIVLYISIQKFVQYINFFIDTSLLTYIKQTLQSV